MTTSRANTHGGSSIEPQDDGDSFKNDSLFSGGEKSGGAVSIKVDYDQRDYKSDRLKLNKAIDTLHPRGIIDKFIRRKNNLIILFGPNDTESREKRKSLAEWYRKDRSKRYNDHVYLEACSPSPDVKPESLVIFHDVHSHKEVEAVKDFFLKPGRCIDVLVTTNSSAASKFKRLNPLQVSAHGVPLLEKRLIELDELLSRSDLLDELRSKKRPAKEHKRIGQLDQLIISEIADLFEVEKDRSKTFYLNHETNHIDGDEQDYMKDVSGLMPLIAKNYPEFIVTIFNRVRFLEVQTIKKDNSDDFEPTERLSDIPEWYGFLPDGRRPESLNWWNPIQVVTLWFQKLEIKEPHVFCVVPLRGICSFEKHGSATTTYRNNGLLNPCSPFTAFVSESAKEEFFEPEFWDAVISFKWRSFAASRYFFFWFLDILFSVFFAVSTTPKVLSEQPYTFETVVMHYVTIFLGAIFLLIEIRQLAYYKWGYFLDIYNFVDVITYLFPLFICGRIVTGNHDTYDIGITAVALIFLWFHFLQSCRVFKPIGIFANIVLGGANKILPFAFIMLIITLGFGHGLWILLDNSGSDDFATDSNGTNKFDGFGSSIKEIYWGWTGDTSAIQVFDGQTWLVDLLRALMVFLLSIYMLNLLIAVLNEGYEKLVDKSVEAHNFQMVRLIAEIEIFLMLPSERKDPKLFPDDIYFEISTSKIEKWKKKLKKAIDPNSEDNSEDEDKLRFLKEYYKRRADRRNKKEKTHSIHTEASSQPDQDQVQPMSIAQIEDFVQDNPDIPELDLKGQHIGDKGADTIIDTLKNNTKLTKMNLKGNGIGDKGMDSIAKYIRRNKTLTDLDLGNNNIGSMGTAALTDSLIRNKTLARLDLGGNKINFSRVQSLDKAIEHIAEMNLQGNYIGEAGARTLANSLKNNESITKLDLGSNGIGEAGIRDLAEMLKKNKTITELNLSGNAFGNEGATSLAEGLKANSTLKKIDLSGCEIGDEGARALAELHFIDNNPVEVMNLRSNKISLDGAIELLKLRSKNPYPVDIDLRDQDQEQLGASHHDLITFLSGRNTDTELNLSNDKFGDGIAHALAHCLRHDSTLIRLDVSSNKIEDGGACALADSLRYNTTLKYLDISSNKFGDESATGLLESLKNNTTTAIVEVNIKGNNISSEVINSLKQEPRILF